MPLIGTLTSGVSALTTFSKSLELIGNNIANVNTTAYKSSSASFTDTFSDTLQSATDASDGAAVQIGTGVQISSVSTDWTQGSLSSTGTTTDLGISGNGYFVVQDPATGNTYATRDGSFEFDSDGYLVNSQGYQVLDASGDPIQVTDYANMSSVSIATDGTITAYDSSGTETDCGQIGLLSIAETSKLEKIGDNLYDFSSTGATLTDNLSSSGSNGLGTIESGTLEQSNVDLTSEFAALITAQRSFQAGSRLITVSDTVLEDVINLKR